MVLCHAKFRETCCWVPVQARAIAHVLKIQARLTSIYFPRDFRWQPKILLFASISGSPIALVRALDFPELLESAREADAR